LKFGIILLVFILVPVVLSILSIRRAHSADRCTQLSTCVVLGKSPATDIVSVTLKVVGMQKSRSGAT
jgi:hypothetical protein